MSQWADMHLNTPLKEPFNFFFHTCIRKQHTSVLCHWNTYEIQCAMPMPFVFITHSGSLASILPVMHWSGEGWTEQPREWEIGVLCAKRAVRTTQLDHIHRPEMSIQSAIIRYTHNIQNRIFVHCISGIALFFGAYGNNNRLIIWVSSCAASDVCAYVCVCSCECIFAEQK